MIRLSNGHVLKYVIASGALGFDGKGYFWEWLLGWLGLIRPELFTVVLRTLTWEPRLYPISNLSWPRLWTWWPWSRRSCVQLLPNGGTVNKVGLWNPGIKYWCEKIGPKLDFQKVKLVASISGTEEELVKMAIRLNDFPLVGLEVNRSCPNEEGPMDAANGVISAATAVAAVSVHPIITKVSVAQDYLLIAQKLEGIAQAISLNSVPWKMAFPGGEKSPMENVGTDQGLGGVSGRPAQEFNWWAVESLVIQGALPVIASSIMEYDDLARVRKLGANAVSFGGIHVPTKGKPWTVFTNPCKPTAIVRRDMQYEQ